MTYSELAEQSARYAQRIMELEAKLAETERYWEECQTEHHKLNIKLAKVVEFIEQCDELCNCGSFDSDQMVTRAECSDCRRAALAAAAKDKA